MTLPLWERGTPGVLCVVGPHAIPVSTAVRADELRVLLALAAGRETLRRLRDDPRAALCILGRSVGFTAYGTASVVREGLEAAPAIIGVELRVESVQDHLADGRTELLDGVRWRWLSEEASAAEPAIVAELERL